MRTTSRIFTILFIFFLVVAAAYGYVTSRWDPMGLEPMGFPAFLMLTGMCAMIAAVTRMNSRRFGPRPEDRDDAEVSDDAGIQGSFAPYSWWPLWTAVAAAMCFLGVAAGFWITGLGVVVAIYAITGWVMEFSLGQHAVDVVLLIDDYALWVSLGLIVGAAFWSSFRAVRQARREAGRDDA